MKKYFIAASRGRDVGGVWQQKIEISTDGCSHAITSVAKDNYVIEHEEENNMLSDTDKLST